MHKGIIGYHGVGNDQNSQNYGVEKYNILFYHGVYGQHNVDW